MCLGEGVGMVVEVHDLIQLSKFQSISHPQNEFSKTFSLPDSAQRGNTLPAISRLLAKADVSIA